MTDYRKNVQYPTISNAIEGDVEAINTIISHYQGYINSLSMIQIIDDNGEKRQAVDDYLSNVLEVHLIMAILKFKI